MKIFFLLNLMVLVSCQARQSKVIVNHQGAFEFKLIDSLGTISMDLPERTDTFFSWIQESDCGKPCEQGDYRFQSKKNRIFKESGFYWVGEPEDSVDQLSIYHQRPTFLKAHNDSLIIKMRNLLREDLLNNTQIGDLISDTLLKIGDRFFCIFLVSDINKIKGIRNRRLIAFTTVKGTLLEFHYKLLSSHYDSILTHFFDRSLKNLMTVRIKDDG